MSAVHTVFVTGATGYIGRSIARAFRAAGWRVLGLTRDGTKAASLAAEEITPVVGTLQDVASWSQAAGSANALVHAAVDYRVDTMALDRAATKALLDISSGRDATFIYTSGAWVHGATGAQVADENTPLAPVEIVAARPATENLVLNATGVRGIVIRPAIVYGRRGGLTAGFFNDQPAVGDGTNHWPLVHVDDLAMAYVLATERARGPSIYLVADESHDTVAKLVAAARRGAGLTGEPKWLSVPEARNAMGGLADALVLDQRFSAARARRELAWRPLHPSFTADAEVYARANRE
jgi:nucleoside-diphosphate-sugar epimerase